VGQPTYDQLLGLAASEVLWLDQFEDHATSEQMESYQEASNVPAVATAQRLRQSALEAGPGGAVANDDLEVWSSSMGRRIDLLEGIAEDTASDLTAATDSRQTAASRRQLLALVWLCATLGLVVALGLLLYRFVIRPLWGLSAAARNAANKTLPAAVEQAQREGPASVRRAFAPLEPPREHELRELATAFNSVQESAATLATSEAASKGNAGAVFLNFGRRTQNLVSRQLGHIDDLEARTDDPDTLSDLFLLDHLATRLRRNAESLVVLAGADSPRRWSRPVTVVNVVRAAAAEAADYSRVDLEPMAPGSVLGAKANDVSHLLAELIDNALAFSPPDCRVTVGGSWEPDGRYVVTVTDAGPGMSPQLLAATNARLAHAAASDPEASHYFGLFVVARFAQRHGVEVQLVPGRPRGTTARVVLPASLLALASATSRTGLRQIGSADPPHQGASVTVLQATTWPGG
jgi:signal transduction histidine kinase